MDRDRVGLSRAISAFQAVSNGSGGDASPWTAATAKPQELFYDKSNFGQLSLELSDLKRARQAISSMEKCLLSDIARLEKLLSRPSLQHGLDSLPDEILLEILVCVISDDNTRGIPLKALQSLLMVSKRFHHLLSGTNEPWAHINTNEGKKTVQRKLAKTHGSKLHYHLAPAQCGRNAVLDMKDVFMLSSRAVDCQTLSFTGIPCYITRHVDSFFSLWLNTDFPSVTSLIVNDMDLLPTSWTFPALTSLSVMALKYPSSVAPFIGLRHLSLQISRSEGSMGPEILDVLRRSPALQTLSLSEVSLKESHSDGLELAKLPLLSSLTLIYSGQSHPEHDSIVDIARLTRALQLPSLRDFSLDLRYRCDFPLPLKQSNAPSRQSILFFADADSRDNLQRLSFRFEPKLFDESSMRYPMVEVAEEDMSAFLPSFIAQFQHLQMLSLRTSPFTTEIMEDLRLLNVCQLNVYGRWNTFSFMPRFIELLRRHPNAKLREAFFVIRHGVHNCFSVEREPSEETTLELTPQTRIILEQTVGDATVTLMERKYYYY